MKKVVIGLVGEKGSGKETFVKILKKLLPQKNIFHTRSSDLLAETLKLWDIPKTRYNLQKLAIVMDEGFNPGTVTYAVKQRILREVEGIVIFDGVRWKTDVLMIKEFKNNFLVYISADLKIRYQRLKAKSDKVSEQGLSYKQFLKEEKEKTELLIPKIGKKADFKITNNGSLADFKKEIKKFISEFMN
jgi:dephospho-CoA kinase